MGIQNTNFQIMEKAVQDKLLAITNNRLLTDALDAIPVHVVIIDDKRSVLYINRSTMEFTEITDRNEVIGKYFGELFKCNHLYHTEHRCGTTNYCRFCGALTSILDGLSGKPSTKECRMLVRKDQIVEALNLQVTSAPLIVGEHQFFMLTIEDISAVVRKQALERIFFHDILNTAYAISSGLELLFDDEATEYREEIKASMPSTAQRLIEEIADQQQLIKAEQNDLEVSPYSLNTTKVVQQVLSHVRNYQRFNNRDIVLESSFEDLQVYTDKTLLVRVLFNMIKNALEAGSGIVRIGSQRAHDMVRFSVRNVEVIPEKVFYQLFQPSFSTKGSGRGFGTYSIKLLTERYLNGEVGVTSTKEDGTEFFICIPDLKPDLSKL